MSFTIKFFLIATFCWLGLLHNNWAQKAKNKKCQLEALAGTWYGEYEVDGGTPYYIFMNFEQIENCQVFGFIHWPQYFNSQLGFQGIQDDSLIILKLRIFIRGTMLT